MSDRCMPNVGRINHGKVRTMANSSVHSKMYAALMAKPAAHIHQSEIE